MTQRIAVLLAAASILVLSCAADEKVSAQKYEKNKNNYVKHDKDYKSDYKKPSNYQKDYKPHPKSDYHKPAPAPYGGKPYDPSYPPYGDKPYDPSYPPYGDKPYDPSYPPYGDKPYQTSYPPAPYGDKPYPPTYPPAPYGDKPYDPAYSPPYGGTPYPPYGSYEPSYAPGGYDSSYATVHAYTACLKEYESSYCWWWGYGESEYIQSDFTFCDKHGEDPPYVGSCFFDTYWWSSYQITANLYQEGDFYAFCEFDKKAAALGHPFGEDLELYVQGGIFYVEKAVFHTGSIHEPVSVDNGWCDDNEKTRRTSGSKHAHASTKLSSLKDKMGRQGAAPQPEQSKKSSRSKIPHHPKPHNSTRARSMAATTAASTAATYDYMNKQYYEADATIFYGYIIGVDSNHGMSWNLGIFEYVNYVSDYNVITESDVQGRKILPDPWTYRVTLFKH